MTQDLTAKLDVELAHRHFSSECFNDAWALIEKSTRTPEEDEAMLFLAMASLWHWTQRADCTERHLSIGHWQVSRVSSLLGQGQNAMRHAKQSMKYSEGAEPFFIGYAHEAAARAALVLGNAVEYLGHLEKAWANAANIKETDDRKQLEEDLRSLESASSPSA
jgi:hypothetical protein